jgi:alpha-amylase
MPVPLATIRIEIRFIAIPAPYVRCERRAAGAQSIEVGPGTPSTGHCSGEAEVHNPPIDSGSPPGGWMRKFIVIPCIVALSAAPASRAQDHPVILQWFEAGWGTMERRAADLFLAGYGAVWLPPPSKALGTGSVGYDVFDRFDLGSPGAATAYGTEEAFGAALGELHQANALIYIDTIMNHCSFRQTGAGFQKAGGYPGFWMAPDDPAKDKQPTDLWGDFHAGVVGGYLQSENPGGPRYDLLKGDLVALIDIAQESNHQFIRHPVDPADPGNIPAGATYNRPTPGNRRFYPDRDLMPFTFTNPGTPRNPGANEFTFYPFNSDDPLQGDPTKDNTTGLLMRWTQWMADEFAIDGFRLDAAKHAPSWFWDVYWDAAVYRRRSTPSGGRATPFSFVESVESNGFTLANYIRKGDGFGNRDGLDLNGAGQLRGLVSADGFGSWQDVVSGHLDTADDGLNNGTIGVNHVFSHDNGSVGDGGEQPPLPSARQEGYAEHAYLLLRPGPAIVYHNARGLTRPGGFWPREGVKVALGLNQAANALDPTLLTLVRLHNWYARGEFNILNGTDPFNQSLSDVLIFERRKDKGGGNYSANLVVAVNDRYDSGTQQRNVRTSFPPGTRLHELTGNAADPLVDPADMIPELLVVDGAGRVALTVPHNVSAAGEHSKGYVVYGPAVPSGELSLTGIAGKIPADPPNAPPHARRLNEVPVVTADTFELRLTTAPADPDDPNTDDNAVFRIDQGFADLNGNGGIDIGEDHAVVPGYEQFLTVHEPLFGGPGPAGVYAQVLDGAALAEGYHYISVVAFRHRDGTDDPLFREFRQAIYLDRVGPAVALIDPEAIINDEQHEFTIRALDRTALGVYLLLDVPPDVDPIPLAGPENMAARRDRSEWTRTILGLTHGFHSLTIVAVEVTGNASAIRYEDVFVDLCRADIDNSGRLDLFDFLAFQNAFVAGEPEADFDNNGSLDLFDFLAFQNEFAAGCL